MKNFILLLSCLSLFVIQSCQIDAVTHFNKDYSGYTSTTLDMSEILGMVSQFGEDEDEGAAALDSMFMMFDGSIENDSVSMFMDSLQTVFAEAGMKNFAFARDGDYGLNMKFDFDDLSVFDGEDMMGKIGQAFGGLDDSGELTEDMFDSMPSSTTVRREGKWLILDFFGMNYDEFKESMRSESLAELEAEGEDVGEVSTEDIEAGMEMAMGMLKMMGDMYQYKMTYSFDRKIKEIETSLDYESDKHSVTVEYNLGDLIDILEKNGNAELRVRLK